MMIGRSDQKAFFILLIVSYNVHSEDISSTSLQNGQKEEHGDEYSQLSSLDTRSVYNNEVLYIELYSCDYE
jgi:hypothetical protein